MCAMQIPNLGGKYMVRGRCNHAKAGCPNSFRYSPIAAGIKAVTGALPRNAPDVRRWPRLMSVIDFYHLAHRTHDAVATLSLLLFLGRRSARHEACKTSMQPATPHGGVFAHWPGLRAKGAKHGSIKYPIPSNQRLCR